jgi:hypothetical protein
VKLPPTGRGFPERKLCLHCTPYPRLQAGLAGCDPGQNLKEELNIKAALTAGFKIFDIFKGYF